MSARESGPIPAGLWRLDPTRSRLLAPKAMTVWILRNTAEDLEFVAVETEPGRPTRVTAWQGRYGGPPAVMQGAGIEARVTSRHAEGIRTEGTFPGLGAFVEFCRLSEDGRQMICDGEIRTEAGPRTYREVFDWYADSPHPAG